MYYDSSSTGLPGTFYLAKFDWPRAIKKKQTNKKKKKQKKKQTNKKQKNKKKKKKQQQQKKKKKKEKTTNIYTSLNPLSRNLGTIFFAQISKNGLFTTYFQNKYDLVEII